MSLPLRPEVQALVRVRPAAEWFAPGFVPGPGCGLVCPVLSSRARACRRNHQVPRVPLPDVGVTSIRETCPASSEDITPRSSLLQTHASIPCGSPLLRLLASFVESSQVATSPCCYRDYPDVISANPSSDAWSRTPAGPTECIYLFLPLCHRPSPCRNWVGFPLFPANTTFRGHVFRGCRHFFMFRPPSLLASQIVPTAVLIAQGSRGFYVRAERASLPPHAPNMLAA
jgi:hypothetical protein